MPAALTYGFILEYVSDIEASKQFFVDVMGLDVERDSPMFVQFKDKDGAGFAIASDESIGGTDEREIYWVVDDAESTYRDLAKRAKVTVPLEQKPFGKVFGIADSAGQPHYVIEFAGDRPSQQVS